MAIASKTKFFPLFVTKGDVETGESYPSLQALKEDITDSDALTGDDHDHQNVFVLRQDGLKVVLLGCIGEYRPGMVVWKEKS